MTHPTPTIVQSKQGAALVETDRLPDLASALAQMHDAIRGMAPEDVVVELDHEHSESRSMTRLRFRAYRRSA
jgi:hypothetical protein